VVGVVALAEIAMIGKAFGAQIVPAVNDGIIDPFEPDVDAAVFGCLGSS